MITLTLLHPWHLTPVQSWKFDNESIVRIGRSADSDVVLYSAVVSRRHVELHRKGTAWQVMGLGSNGTYLEGERITESAVTDGMVIRLARSGPLLKINLGPVSTSPGSQEPPVSGMTESVSSSTVPPSLTVDPTIEQDRASTSPKTPIAPVDDGTIT